MPDASSVGGESMNVHAVKVHTKVPVLPLSAYSVPLAVGDVVKYTIPSPSTAGDEGSPL